MNLQKFFEMQSVLDKRILDRFPELKNQNNLDWKILALQVELGELANEWRGFKKWSEDQEARTKSGIDCNTCRGRGYYELHSKKPCVYCEGAGWNETNPLLEEYVDCLHFILSIGLEIDFQSYLEAHNLSINSYDTTASNAESIDFNNLFISIANLADSTDGQDLRILFIEFIKLGEMLGFTWEQIEQGYMNKNKINHERQANNY